MAVFTSTQELDQQAQHKNFQKQTGWKKTAMMLSGYKDTGEKNTFGRFAGGSPMMTIGGNVFSKGSSAEEVVKSQRSKEIGHQIGVAKFVGSIMTAGAGGAAGGAASGGASAGASGVGGAATSGGGLFAKAGTKGLGAGGGATKAGAFMSKVGGGGSQTIAQGGKGSVMDSMFKEGSKASELANSEGGKRLTNELTSQAKQKIKDGVNSSGDPTVEDELPNEDAYTTGVDENGNPISAEAQAGNAQVDTTTESGSAKAMGTAAGATSAIPIIGEGIGLYAEKMAIADAHTAKRKEIAGRTYQGNQGRRV